MNDALVERLRKLLALGTSSNPHEAEAALLKAKELAVQNEIDLAAIAVFGETKVKHEPITQDRTNLGKRMPLVQHWVTRILQNHFNVRVIYTGSRHFGRYLNLVGRKSDIEIATFVNSFLTAEFMRLWHRYQTTNNAETRQRDSFIYGVYHGLDDKLAAKTKQTETTGLSNVSQETRANYALVVRNLKEEVDSKVNEFYPHLSHARARGLNLSSGHARSAGYAAGEQINIARPITNGTANKQIQL